MNAALVTTVALLIGGCIDFGYSAQRWAAPDAGPLDATPDTDAPEVGTDAPGCVEGAEIPSATGPQVRFGTLNVDTPILSVRAGDVVTWTNGDTMAHTVTQGVPGAPGAIASGVIAPSASWAYRFCDPRTIVYFCETHPAQMNGYRIVITP